MEEKFLQEDGQGEEKSSQFQTRRNLNSNSPEEGSSLFCGQNDRLFFSRDEKLKGNKLIDILFLKGKSVSKNGFTLIFYQKQLKSNFPAQAGFSVPKRNFKSAVARNRIKRLMRESYRLNKSILYKRLEEHKTQMVLMFIYKGKEMPDYDKTSQAINYCLQQIAGI